MRDWIVLPKERLVADPVCRGDYQLQILQIEKALGVSLPDCAIVGAPDEGGLVAFQTDVGGNTCYVEVRPGGEVFRTNCGGIGPRRTQAGSVSREKLTEARTAILGLKLSDTQRLVDDRIHAVFRQIVDQGEPLSITTDDPHQRGAHMLPDKSTVVLPKGYFVFHSVEDWVDLVFMAGHEAGHVRVERNGDFVLYPFEEQCLCDTLSVLSLLTDPGAATWLQDHPDAWNARIQAWTGGGNQPVRQQLLTELLKAALGADLDANGQAPSREDRHDAIYSAIAKALPHLARSRSDSRLKGQISDAVSRLLPYRAQ